MPVTYPSRPAALLVALSCGGVRQQSEYETHRMQAPDHHGQRQAVPEPRVIQLSGLRGIGRVLHTARAHFSRGAGLVVLQRTL